MNITLRLIVSLVVIITSITLLSTYFLVNEEKVKQYEELDRRSLLLAESLQEVIEPQLERKNYQEAIRSLKIRYPSQETKIQSRYFPQHLLRG